VHTDNFNDSGRNEDRTSHKLVNIAGEKEGLLIGVSSKEHYSRQSHKRRINTHSDMQIPSST
jgi:hypothetical protein